MKAKKKYMACEKALKEYAQNNGFEQVLIGLSGGIDSSVTATLCVDAFGLENVHGLLLPGPYSSTHSIEDALELARNLGIETQIVSICEPFSAFEQVLASACGGTLSGIAAQNTQARCRMVALMALSNAHNWMLVNTGNKSEAAMGYSTLYGDTAGAFAPLGGLYKTDVYKIGKWRNEEAKRKASAAIRSDETNASCASSDASAPSAAPNAPSDAGASSTSNASSVSSASCAPSAFVSSQALIPERVFTKPPSAELSSGQEDEKSLGIRYEVLDTFLIAWQEKGQSIKKAAQKAGISLDEARRIAKTVAFYAFKRSQEPPFPRTKFYA